MAKYVTDDGKEIEVKFKPEDYEASLKAKSELEAKTKALEEEVGKLKDKDNNFGAYRRATAEEKKKLEETFSEKEKDMYRELDSLKNELGTYRDNSLGRHKKAVLTQLAGNDDDLKKRIEDASKSFSGEIKNEEDLENRLRNGYTLVVGSQPKQNPIHSFVPSEGSNENLYSNESKKRFTDTEEGSALFAKSFPHLVKKQQQK